MAKKQSKIQDLIVNSNLSMEITQPRVSSIIHLEYATHKDYKNAFSLFHRIMFRIYTIVLPGLIKVIIKNKVTK